jgi:hypothetical protein
MGNLIVQRIDPISLILAFAFKFSCSSVYFEPTCITLTKQAALFDR